MRRNIRIFNQQTAVSVFLTSSVLVAKKAKKKTLLTSKRTLNTLNKIVYTIVSDQYAQSIPTVKLEYCGLIYFRG